MLTLYHIQFEFGITVKFYENKKKTVTIFFSKVIKKIKAQNYSKLANFNPHPLFTTQIQRKAPVSRYLKPISKLSYYSLSSHLPIATESLLREPLSQQYTQSSSWKNLFNLFEQREILQQCCFIASLLFIISA